MELRVFVCSLWTASHSKTVVKKSLLSASWIMLLFLAMRNDEQWCIACCQSINYDIPRDAVADSRQIHFQPAHIHSLLVSKQC